MNRQRMIALLVCLMCFASAPAWADGKVGLTLLGGWASPMAGEAMSGRDGDSGPADSSFKSNWTLGAEAAYKFASGFSLGIGVQHLSLTAEAARSGGSKADFAKLNMTPLYALARYQFPVETGFTGHFEAGLGINLTSADKESALDGMASALGQSVDISTSDDLAGFVGAGADYYFNPKLSMGLSLRYWWTRVEYDITASRLGNLSKGTFDGQNLQTLLSLTYWF
ncbi:MAG: outer membrane beta-barrel protein [Pseudomonadota bacterium]